MYNPQFDIDLKYGEAGETLLRRIVDGTVEVKRDRQWATTGNVVVEYESRGHPSGIAVTKADWWAFVLDETRIILIRTEHLKNIARVYKRMGRIVIGGDDDTSKMVLIPSKELTRNGIGV